MTTVIGGPHATSFPEDAKRFFDFVVLKCNKNLIKELLDGHLGTSGIISSGRTLKEFPLVEERMPEIRKSAFFRGKPIAISIVPLISSIGCPYQCDFCIDWNNHYFPLPTEQLKTDLQYLALHYPKLLLAFHDPNFAVRFDETMDVMDQVQGTKKSRYIMESSLSIMKKNRLQRLQKTGCAYVAPGVESWSDYSNKSASLGLSSEDKLENTVEHFQMISEYVPGIQANFIFGSDVDQGSEPVALTKEFIRRLPQVWPALNVPTPFGATPLYKSYLENDRILKSMPFTLYYTPYLVIKLKHYESLEYYCHMIELYEYIVSLQQIKSRLFTKCLHPLARFVHLLRLYDVKQELSILYRIRNNLVEDSEFRAFYNGQSNILPAYYRQMIKKRLGNYAELLSDEDLIPDWDQLGKGAEIMDAPSP